ncbi:hypothetical protein BC629DRAFT_645889 [Irpex lacteus]|nr:hypothetical protein BC629DRAFT_645889 [Irpex lacteus]
MASVNASDAHSIVDPGGTQEAPVTDALVAPTFESRDAPPQERSGGVDVSSSTCSFVPPQSSVVAGDFAALAASSSGMGAVQSATHTPVLHGSSSACTPIPSPPSSLVGSATVSAVVDTNSIGDVALQPHGLSNASRSKYSQGDDPTVEALIKTGWSDIGVVNVHGTTSLRGASGACMSGLLQDPGAMLKLSTGAPADLPAPSPTVSVE